MQRQNDGILSPFPIWDDVRTFDGTSWRGIVDVVSGGFPCQDISAAGKGAGLSGTKSSLWFEQFRIICEVRPRIAFVENSPLLTVRGIATILGSLAAMGFDAEWGVLGADDAGSPHIRKRIWILAYASSEQRERESKSGEFKFSSVIGNDGPKKTMADTAKQLRTQQRRTSPLSRWNIQRTRWWETEPEVGRVVDGMAYRLDQLRALGDGQVPAVVQLAWKILNNIRKSE